jgi:hypothetical protein
MQTFGHDGDSEMLADIFHKLDEAKKNSRVWDRQYNQLKAQEEFAMNLALHKKEASQRTWNVLVGASELFEKRDMKRWSEDRRTAIKEAMTAQDTNLKECKVRLKEEKKNLEPLMKQRQALEEQVAKRVSRGVPDKAADDKVDLELLKLNKQIGEQEEKIEKLEQVPREARFHVTETKHKDGFLDLKEFRDSFKKATDGS